MENLHLYITPTRLHLTGVDPSLPPPRSVRLLSFDRQVPCPPTLSSITVAHPALLTPTEALDIVDAKDVRRMRF